MDDICTGLNERIGEHINYLATENIGSEDAGNIIDDTVKLYKLRLDEKQQELESEKLNLEKAKLAEESKQREQNLVLEKAKLAEESKQREQNLVLEKAKLKEQKLSRYFSTGVKVATIVGTAVFTILGFAREFDGTITSNMLKQNLNFWKPDKN